MNDEQQSSQIIHIVCGPTATGKTGYAIELARKVNGELISADSRQIYKDLPITTNLGEVTFLNNLEIENLDRILPVHTIEEVSIHLVNFLNIDQRFNLSDWRELADHSIQEIISRDKTPILVGGTGLYIDSLVKNYDLGNDEEIDWDMRSKLESLELIEIQHRLRKISSSAFDKLNNSDKNNKRRLVRLIEKSKSDSQGSNIKDTNIDDFKFVFHYPEYDWDELKIKISKRVEQMLEEGLVEEVQLARDKFGDDVVGLSIMGAREVVSFLKDEISSLKMLESIVTAHTKYAKRQRTWFEGKGRGYIFDNFW